MLMFLRLSIVAAAAAWFANAEDLHKSFLVAVKKDARLNEVGLRLVGTASISGHAYNDKSFYGLYLEGVEDVDAILSDPDVLSVEANQRVEAVAHQDLSEDALDMWGLDRLDDCNGLDAGSDGKLITPDHGGDGVHLYIIDDGVRLDHNDFSGRMAPDAENKNFHSDGGHWSQCASHGTFVAGLAAGTTYGVAKKSIIHSIRVLGCSGTGTVAGVLSGIEEVEKQCLGTGRLCVVNMSLSTGNFVSESLVAATNALVNMGVAVVVAAGNDKIDACNTSPAAASKAMTVGATDRFDNVASFSNVGSCVNMFAPGESVKSADANGPTLATTGSGTSYSAPYVAGAVALFMQEGVSPEQVYDRLLNRALSGVIGGLKDTDSPDAYLTIRRCVSFDEEGLGDVHGYLGKSGILNDEVSVIVNGKSAYVVEGGRLYDTENPNNDDVDLVVPSVGKILIAQNGTVEDLHGKPNDDRNGASFRFLFDRPVYFDNMILIDSGKARVNIKGPELGIIRLTARAGDFPVLGDNEAYAILSKGIDGVDFARVKFPATGAIDVLSYI